MFSAFLVSIVCLHVLSSFDFKTAAAAEVALGLPDYEDFEPEEEMIFEVRLDNKYLLERGLFAFYRSDKIYLPLAEVCRLLEFPISVNAGNGTAAGWYLNENRRFALDITNRQVVSGELRESVEDGEFYRLTDDIYVSDQCLTRWFPIRVEASIRTLTVNIVPLEKLPIMLKMELDARWSRLRPSQKQALLPLQRSRYQFFSTPVADLTVSSNFNKNDSHYIPTNYTVNLANDMLNHTALLYASGNDKDGLTAARLRMTWEEQSENEKAWVGYNAYSFGDITPSAMPLIPTLRSGRGVYVSNAPLNYTSEFAFTTISGNLPEGWSAELYRGRSLIDTIAPDQSRDEMYYFENVPILTGNNEFIVKLYGPYGQVREEKQSLFVGSGMVTPQKAYYKLSVLQNNRDMLPVRKRYSVPTEGYTVRSEVTAGLSPGLSLKHDFAGFSDDDDEYYYSTIEALGSISGSGDLPPVHGSVGLVSQIDAGNALMLRTRSNLAGWNISNEYFDFDRDFTAATAMSNTDWRNTFSLSGRLFDRQSMSLRWLRDSYNSDRFSDLVNLSLSSRIGQTTLLNTFDHRKDWTSSRSSYSNTYGNTEVRTRVGMRGELSAGLNYYVKPVTEFRSVGIGGRWYGRDDSSYSAQIRRNLASQSGTRANTTYNIGFMKEYTEFSSGLQFSGDSDGDLRAMLTLNSSFGVLPDSGAFEVSSESMVRSGGVIVSVAQRTKDGVIPLKDVEVSAGGRKALTDASGTAIIRGLTPSRRVDVTVEPVSLVDPFLILETPGVSIIPRPGVMQRLDYFVVMTSEIEGNVLFASDGAKKPVGGIMLEITEEETGKVAGRTRTDSQGFYILDFIRPGNYYVDIDQQQANNLGVYVANLGLVKVTDTGDVVTEHDIVLRDQSKAWVPGEADPTAVKLLNTSPPMLLPVSEIASVEKPEIDFESISSTSSTPTEVIASTSLPAEPELSIELLRQLSRKSTAITPTGSDNVQVVLPLAKPVSDEAKPVITVSQPEKDSSVIPDEPEISAEATRAVEAILPAKTSVTTGSSAVDTELSIELLRQLSRKSAEKPAVQVAEPDILPDEEPYSSVTESVVMTDESPMKRVEEPLPLPEAIKNVADEVKPAALTAPAETSATTSPTAPVISPVATPVTTKSPAAKSELNIELLRELSRKSSRPADAQSGAVLSAPAEKVLVSKPAPVLQIKSPVADFTISEKIKDRAEKSRPMLDKSVSAATPSALRSKTAAPVRVNSPNVGNLLQVPAGAFQRDGNPANKSLVLGFYMGQYEVTRAQYAQVTDLREPVTPEEAELPAENLSWYDALVFCNRLSILEGLTPAYRISGSQNPDDWGKVPVVNNQVWNSVVCDWTADGYRLPTEMEWAWAAMGADSLVPGQINIAGYQKAFAGSNLMNQIGDYAWYLTNANAVTQLVGSKKPNELGLYGLSGNVSEWCWDFYADYPAGPLCNYQGPETGSQRVDRGGSYKTGESFMAVSSRASCAPSVRNKYCGLRVVRSETLY